MREEWAYTRVKWSGEKLAYTHAERERIMACIQRLNVREGKELKRVSLHNYTGRAQLRDWFYERWRYLLAEYEKVLPHVEELPPR
jgi:hypothetical protein